MLLGRIEENHIVTLKLRGLPYSVLISIDFLYRQQKKKLENSLVLW